jgi:hypothetical protein
MKNQSLIFTLISFLAVPAVRAADLPAWITQGQTIDSTYFYVVCSHDGLDPEDVKQVAESKCLASAAKLGGVTVKVNTKTVQSLTGADSSEVAEIQPLTRNVKCEWIDRYLEKVEQGFRVWLRCRVKKSSVASTMDQTDPGSSIETSPNDPSPSLSAYKRAILTVTMVPKADRLIVVGTAGERVIEVTSNVFRVELHEGDAKVTARKQKYQDASFNLKPWKHGDVLAHTIYFEEEM